MKDFDMAVQMPDARDLSKRLQRTAMVEVMCGTDHTNIWVPGRGWSCRYARGGVRIGNTGLISKKHGCHRCGCFWGMKSNTPPEKQVCDNCGGPAMPSGQPSCFPDLLVVPDFVEVPEWRERIG